MRSKDLEGINEGDEDEEENEEEEDGEAEIQGTNFCF